MSETWGNRPRYGEYEIVGALAAKPRLLAAGGLGKTYEAFRAVKVGGEIFREYAALKVLSPELLPGDSQRFKLIQALESWPKVRHGNLARCLQYGEEAGELYLVAELCRGGSLVELVSRFGALPERIVALIARQTLAGLREIHQLRLVERGLNPAKILLSDPIDPGFGLSELAFQLEFQANLCRIVDFGLYGLAATLLSSRIRPADAARFASPEEIGEQPVDARSDLYSLGLTLAYLVQGAAVEAAPVAPGKRSKSRGRQEAGAGTAFVGFPAGTSPELGGIISRLIAARPEERFATAAEAAQAFEEFLHTHPEPTIAFPLTRLSSRIDAAYELEAPVASGGSGHHYPARHHGSPERVRLTVARELAPGEPGAEAEATARDLCWSGALASLVSRPKPLLPVLEVVLAAEMLCYVEPLLPHVSTADFLRSRLQIGKPVSSLKEALAVLGPVAEALDFLLQYGQEAILLSCDRLWLTGSGLNDDASVEPDLTQLNERPNLQVYFSVVAPHLHCSEEASSQDTLSGSVDLASDPDRVHPVAAFARLIYRILAGSEAPAAIKYSRDVYVPVVTLSSAANNLLRDVLSQNRECATPSALLRELCAYEAISWRPTRRESGGRTTSLLTTAPDGAAPRPPTVSTSPMPATAAIPPPAPTPPPSPSPAPPETAPMSRARPALIAAGALLVIGVLAISLFPRAAKPTAVPATAAAPASPHLSSPLPAIADHAPAPAVPSSGRTAASLRAPTIEAAPKYTPRALTLTGQDSDYDFIEARWLGPLEGDKSRPPEAMTVIPIDAPETAPLPPGKYRLTLAGGNPAKVDSFLFKDNYEVKPDAPAAPLELPPGIAAGREDGWCGQLSRDTQGGTTTFVTVKVGKKLGAIELKQIEADQQTVVILGEYRPKIGELETNPREVHLRQPGKLVFTGALLWCEARCTLVVDRSSATLLVEPLIPAEDDAIIQLRERMLAGLHLQANDAMLPGASKFQAADVSLVKDLGWQKLKTFALYSNTRDYKLYLQGLQDSTEELAVYGPEFGRGLAVRLSRAGKDMAARRKKDGGWEFVRTLDR